jgi:hypothetical protein
MPRAGRRHGYHDAQDLWDIKMLRLQWNTCILTTRVQRILSPSIRFCTMQSKYRWARKVGSKIESYGLNTGNCTRHAIKSAERWVMVISMRAGWPWKHYHKLRCAATIDTLTGHKLTGYTQNICTGKCQRNKREEWILGQNHWSLPAPPLLHVVTLPSSINASYTPAQMVCMILLLKRLGNAQYLLAKKQGITKWNDSGFAYLSQGN